MEEMIGENRMFWRKFSSEKIGGFFVDGQLLGEFSQNDALIFDNRNYLWR